MMNNMSGCKSRSVAWTGVVLFCVLVALYTLTFLGINVSNDELYLFDSSESFVKRGNFRITYRFDVLASSLEDESEVPFPLPRQEILQPILAAPLFWLAQQTPDIGLMHTVWFFNVMVTAATASLLFFGGRWLGYSTEVALRVAIVYGVATIAWPYSRTFFREPLTALFVLGAFLSASRQPGGWKWMVGLGLSIVGLATTKLGISIILPAVLLLTFRTLPRRQHLILLMLAGLTAVVGFFAIGEVSGISRFQIGYWRRMTDNIEWRYVWESFFGYWISPGRSILLFSPILILAFPGGYYLYKQGKWRLPVAVLSALVLVMLSYGVRSELWWGGSHWGPRHMVPLIPTICLLLLPIMSRLDKRSWLIIVLLLGLLSIGVQLLGILVPMQDYYDYLTANAIQVWDDGLWSWRWSPIPRYMALLDMEQPEVAWLYSSHAIWPVIGLTITTLLLGLGWLSWRRYVSVAFIFPVLTILSVGVGLYSLRDDPRYRVDDAAVRQMIDKMNEQVGDESAIFIQHTFLSPTFWNYFKPDALVAALPYAPGENFNPAVDPPAMMDAPPETLLGTNAVRVMDWAAREYDDIWIVVDTVPAIPNELRPTERYLVENYFWVEDFRFSDQLRAVRFAAVRAPSVSATETDFQFDGEVRLRGYDLPAGAQFRAGEVVPVSLVWQPMRPIGRDYLVSVQIALPAVPPIAQQDGLPQASFGHMSAWDPEQVYRDNYGILLPDDVAPGEYGLQVIVYRYPEQTRLALADGGDIAVLHTIVVE